MVDLRGDRDSEMPYIIETSHLIENVCRNRAFSKCNFLTRAGRKPRRLLGDSSSPSEADHCQRCPSGSGNIVDHLLSGSCRHLFERGLPVLPSRSQLFRPLFVHLAQSDPQSSSSTDQQQQQFQQQPSESSQNPSGRIRTEHESAHGRSESRRTSTSVQVLFLAHALFSSLHSRDCVRLWQIVTMAPTISSPQPTTTTAAKRSSATTVGPAVGRSFTPPALHSNTGTHGDYITSICENDKKKKETVSRIAYAPLQLNMDE